MERRETSDIRVKITLASYQSLAQGMGEPKQKVVVLLY